MITTHPRHWSGRVARHPIGLTIIAIVLFALLLSIALAGAARATQSDEGWHTWATTNTSEPNNQTVNYPQTYVGPGQVAPECGVWYQQDRYEETKSKKDASIADVIADGILTNGEDHHLTQEWEFVYGGDCEEPPVDYCDPSQKDTTGSIGQWLAKNEVNKADCFTVTESAICGIVDVDVDFHGPYAYGAQWSLDPTPVYPANSFPAGFLEDDGGGEVTLYYWLVGPESDYLTGSSLPNLWDGTSKAVTVDTDCLVSEPDPTPTPTPTPDPEPTPDPTPDPEPTVDPEPSPDPEPVDEPTIERRTPTPGQPAVPVTADPTFAG